MNRRRFVAGVTATACAVSLVAIPQARAWEVEYTEATDSCVISFSETDQNNINGAYATLFNKLAKNSFEQVEDQETLKVYTDYMYAHPEVTDTIGFTHGGGLAVTNAQSKLFITGSPNDKANYSMGAAMLKAARTPVLAERALEMTANEAYNAGSTYGVPTLQVLAGVAWANIVGDARYGDTIGEVIESGIREVGPEVARPIYNYGEAFKTCANRKSGTGKVNEGSSMTTDQLLSSIGAGVAGILALMAVLGFAARPAIEGALAQIGIRL